jgi:diguanylate cyclase (GGDEF)-like protein
MRVLDEMMPAQYGALVATITDHDRLARAEQTALGSNHAEVGAWLLRHWNLPEYLQLAVAGSNDPAAVQAPRDLIFIVPCVALSGRIADVWLYPDDEHISIRAVNAASQWLDMEEDEYRTVLDAMAEALPEVSALFEIKLIDPLQIAGVLDQAKELLALRNLREAAEARQKTEILESRTRILEEQQHLDALTGLFNRGRLDEVLNTEFHNASKRGWPLSVAFIDLDHFKEINDTYGHQAGDWVLASIARLLAASMRKTDVVARYGGEEFVLVLPGTGGEAAQTVLERALASIREQAHPIDEGQSIRVTASMGLATHMEGGHQFESSEELVRAADRALYAAKRAGRNRLVR